MQKVIVRVPGAGSLVVECSGPKEIFDWIKLQFIGTTFNVKEAKRGAPKKIKPEASVVSEGAAG